VLYVYVHTHPLAGVSPFLLRVKSKSDVAASSPPTIDGGRRKRRDEWQCHYYYY
jgi:hypothetical protein